MGGPTSVAISQEAPPPMYKARDLRGIVHDAIASVTPVPRTSHDMKRVVTMLAHAKGCRCDLI